MYMYRYVLTTQYIVTIVLAFLVLKCIIDHAGVHKVSSAQI